MAFPRQHARTQRFSLGVPRAFTVAPDGDRCVFLRARGPEDPEHLLWSLDLGGPRPPAAASGRPHPATGDERLVVDPADLGAAAELSPEERARRERVREGGGGIVSYATDRAVTKAVFTLGATAYVADLVGDGGARALPNAGPVVDPRLDPTGTRVAFVRDGALWVTTLDGDEQRIVGEDHPDVTWGLAEFVAAEEMSRTRGHWWSPDGTRLVAARVDVAPVQRWHIADPAHPERPATTVAYPAATTANAIVGLAILDLDGTRTDVTWDAEAFPYLVHVGWPDDAPLTVVVQSRDQRLVRVITVDGASGVVTVAHEQRNEHWVELIRGSPRWLPGGRLVATVDADDTRRLALDGEPVTPAGLQVRQIVAAGEDGVVVTASGADPTAISVWRVPVNGGEAEPLTPVTGVHEAAGTATVVVTFSRSLGDAEGNADVEEGSRSTDDAGRRAEARDEPDVTVTVHGPRGPMAVRNLAATPVITPRPTMLRLGERDLRAALLLPEGHHGGPLPVLLDPYGGPHAQRVLRRRDIFCVPQWFADQGFAVLVADGRGSPGRGPAWEKAVAGDLAGPPLEDQVDALHAAAEAHPGLLDLDRVAIRGWSFGGFLAALAVLRRPDVFHAAIAGAPVTDQRLYDTHYTERYLGVADGPAYDRSSIIADAPDLERPLLLIHGLADDNVVAAHTLRLSQALLAAGRPHQVLPLSGVTHMTPQEDVAANLLLLQLAFLRDALSVPT